MAVAVTGLNHVTLAVTDVPRSVSFYHELLGFKLRAEWAEGAYLEAGGLWLCLSYDEEVHSSSHADYTHTAFTVSDQDYDEMRARLIARCIIWKEDRSEGASTYFRDPDGHKLEIHLGSLETRLAYLRNSQRPSLRVFD